MSRSPVIFPSFVADYTYFLRTGSFLYFDTLNSFPFYLPHSFEGGDSELFLSCLRLKENYS